MEKFGKIWDLFLYRSYKIKWLIMGEVEVKIDWIISDDIGNWENIREREENGIECKLRSNLGK